MFKILVSLLSVSSIISRKIFNIEKLVRNTGIVFYEMGTVGISPWFLSNLCRGQESRECYHYNSLDNSRHMICMIRGVDINCCITPGITLFKQKY